MENLWFLGILLCAFTLTLAGKLEEVYSWNKVDYEFPNNTVREEAIASKAFIPEHNIPVGVEKWQNKLFLTVPRWKTGVPASLTYIDLTKSADTKSPKLIPYPNWESHDLTNENDTRIISPYRIRADECDRLWVLDSGIDDVLGSFNVMTGPYLLIYNLNTNELIRKYEIPTKDLSEHSFVANVVVDITKSNCEDAYAYISDFSGYAIIVYSFAKNESWRVNHNFFHFDPLSGDYTIGKVNFQWTDGIFGLALSPVHENGFRTMYFHAMSSTKEFTVSTEVLKNKTRAVDPHSYYDFKLLGDRGDKTQSTTSFIDEPSNVLFYTQINRDGIACWNIHKPFTADNLVLFDSDNTTLVFPNDLKVDSDSNLWVVTDRLPIFMYSHLDYQDNNFRVLKGAVKNIIADTRCA